MRILFVTASWGDSRLPDGSGWYRGSLPARELSRHGHETFHTGRMAVDKHGAMHGVGQTNLEARFADPDVVVIQRWMNAEMPDQIRRARACGQVVVQDIDDWYLGLDPRNRAFIGTHPKFSPKANREHLFRSFAASDAMWVSTPFLADGYRRYNDNIRVLRNPIDLERWDALYADRHHGGRRPTVGWVGSTRWRSGDLETLKGVLAPLVRKHGLRVIHSGSVNIDGDHEEGAAAEALGMDADDVDVYAAMSIRAYPSLFARIDVGLVPLADRPFNEAKSALKGMEYSAARVPFVAGGSSEYRWLQAQGAGLVAKRPRDWIRHIERLLDPEVRAVEAAANRAALVDRDIYWRWRDWQAALEDLVGPAAAVA